MPLFGIPSKNWSCTGSSQPSFSVPGRYDTRTRLVLEREPALQCVGSALGDGRSCKKSVEIILQPLAPAAASRVPIDLLERGVGESHAMTEDLRFSIQDGPAARRCTASRGRRSAIIRGFSSPCRDFPRGCIRGGKRLSGDEGGKLLSWMARATSSLPARLDSQTAVRIPMSRHPAHLTPRSQY